MAAKNAEQEELINQVTKKTNELTTNTKSLEIFARETYRMKKSNEVIFLFLDKEELH